MMNNRKKALLAEVANDVYERFLHTIFKDNTIDISEKHTILFYCFFYKGISFNQLTILFGNTDAKRKSLAMQIKRLKDSDLMISPKNLSVSKKSTRYINANIYLITNVGVKYCIPLLEELIPQYINQDYFKSDDILFEIKDITEYLATKCINNSPAYWNHYVSIRDINVYLLSAPLAAIDYTYDTEVPISETGFPLSIYAKSYLGVGQRSSPIRSDGFIKYPLPGSDEIIQMFLELDTGSQRSSILVDKVTNYYNHYMLQEAFSPNTSLLFCLNTKVDEDKKSISELKGGYGIKSFYYLFTLECVIEILKHSENIDNITTGQVLKYIEDICDSNTPSLSQLHKYITDLSINGDLPIALAKRQYFVNRNDISEKRINAINNLHHHKYVKRRNLLHRSLEELPHLIDYFYKGFSLYTIPSYDIDGTFPYLVLEMFQYKAKLKRLFSSINLINMANQLIYTTIYYYESDYCLKNSYRLSSNSEFHVIIENIVDDLGGFYRVERLLNLNQVPSSLSSTILICLIDETCIDRIADIYISSPLGTLLNTKDGSSNIIPLQFNVLFATYDTFKTIGSFFKFDSCGNMIFIH